MARKPQVCKGIKGASCFRVTLMSRDGLLATEDESWYGFDGTSTALQGNPGTPTFLLRDTDSLKQGGQGKQGKRNNGGEQSGAAEQLLLLALAVVVALADGEVALLVAAKAEDLGNALADLGAVR